MPAEKLDRDRLHKFKSSSVTMRYEYVMKNHLWMIEANVKDLTYGLIRDGTIYKLISGRWRPQAQWFYMEDDTEFHWNFQNKGIPRYVEKMVLQIAEIQAEDYPVRGEAGRGKVIHG